MGQEPQTGGARSRRRLLGEAGAALATTAMGASAGCLDFLPPASRPIRYGDVDVPTRGDADPTYRRWFPAPDALPDTLADPDVENWVYVTPGDLGRDELGAPFDIGQSVVQSRIDYVGYPIQSYDRLVGLDDLGSVVEATVDRAVVRETLARTSFEPAASIREYDVYDDPALSKLVAVGDDALVHATGERRREKAETIVDASAGRIDRRHDVDDTFRAFTDRIGTAPTLLSAFGVLDNATADCLRYTFDESAAYYVHEHRFERGAVPSRSEIKRQVSGLTRGEVAASVDITIADRHVTVALQLDVSAYGRGDDPYRSTPFVTWGVTHRDDAVHVEHQAGDPVPVPHLEIEPDDALRDPPRDGTTLEPGDVLVFSASALAEHDDHIELIFRQSEGSRQLLFAYDSDENATTT